MKLGAKLIAGFIMVALCCVGVVAANFSQMQTVEKSIDDIGENTDDIDANIDDIDDSTTEMEDEMTAVTEGYAVTRYNLHELSTEVYQEQILMNSFITETNDTQLSSIEADVNNSISEVESLITTIDNSLESDAEKSILADVSDEHDELVSVFDEYKQERYGEIAFAEYQWELGQEARALRHDVSDPYIYNTDVYGDMFKQYITYSYVWKGETKTGNDTGELLYEVLEKHEKQYFWQYRDEANHDKWLKDVVKIRAYFKDTDVVLPQSDKDLIDSAFVEYEAVCYELLDSFDLDDPIFLAREQWKVSQEMRTVRHVFSDYYVYNTDVYGDYFRIYRPFTYTWNGETKSDNTTGEYLYEVWEKHEKQWLWQYRDEANHDKCLKDTTKISAYLEITNLDEANKTIINDAIDDWWELADGFLDAYTRAENSMEKIEERRANWVANVSAEVEGIQIGESDTDSVGLDHLIGLQDTKISEAQANAMTAASDAELASTNVVNAGAKARESGDKAVNTIDRATQIALIIGIAAIIISIILGAGISESVSRPVVGMTEAAERIREGDLDVTVDERGTDEIAELGKTFNHMTSNLKQTVTELKRSNAELEQFIKISYHDLQEPLRMVNSYVQLLEHRYKGKLDPDADEFIGYAVDGATRMKQLINDLLTYSRVDSRPKPLQPTDCEALLDQTVSNLQGAIDESNGKVTYDSLPTVMANGSQLYQLFQNLIDNALKFRGDSQPHVHISAEENGNEWVFYVRDNGIGIEPQYTDRIFKIFQRLHCGKEYQGTGIGLAVCKKVVERHGGQIWVESEPEKGSTFYFTIPKRGGERP